MSNLFKLEPPHAFAKDIPLRNALAFDDGMGRELINFCARNSSKAAGKLEKVKKNEYRYMLPDNAGWSSQRRGVEIFTTWL